jgi:adenylate cyclase
MPERIAIVDEPIMQPDAPAQPQAPLQLRTFDDALGRRIIEMHVWAVREGLHGTTAYDLFDGFCQRLVIDGVPLWRAYAAMETLHPQWSGYGYTWRRDLNAIQPEHFSHGDDNAAQWRSSPFHHLIQRAQGGEPNPSIRRRLETGPEQRDFPVLDEFFAAGATDYFSQLFSFGEHGDRSHGSGTVYSFATDRRGGFSDDDTTLLQATLPALSLAMKAHAGHVIASGLLQAYLGEDAGRRVHAGAIERGSVESLNAVLWYADIRGFTATADTSPGLVVIDLLDDVFETLTASLRPRGGQVLKFLGDGMLATFSFEAGNRAETCRRALDAAVEAMQALDERNAARAAAGAPGAVVDLALHVGEVLYGNVGATDRLDFTVIGPAVNEVARIEALCQPLDRKVLVSAEFAAASEDGGSRLEPLGRHSLRGIREAREIFAVSLDRRRPRQGETTLPASAERR